MSKSSRSEAAVLEELEQTMESVVKREEELQKAIKTLDSSKKQLASKEKELALKSQEVQEQVDSLMHEFETTIKKRKLDLAGQKKQAQAEAFSVMVEEAEEELADVTAAIKAKTEEYDKIDKTVRELRQRKGLLTDIAEADHKISLIQLVKDNLNDLSDITSEHPQDQEVIDDIVQKLKRENTHYREFFLDDLIRQEEQSLTQKLDDAGETRESLNDFVQDLIQASTKAQTEPKDFLDNLILVGNTEKEKKLKEITALEKQENALEANLKELRKLEPDIDRIELPEEIAEKLARQERLIRQREKEVRKEVIGVDNSGQSEIGKIVNELDTLKENIKRQEQVVKDARKSLYQEEEHLGILESEHSKLLKQPKIVKKQQEEDVPEQFYLSTSLQFSQLSETIKHRKELNRLKSEHTNAQALLEEQIEQLKQANRLQQQLSGSSQEELEFAKRLNQEQQERIEELEKQIALFSSSAPSLADEIRELEEHGNTPNLSELQALIEKQNAELKALRAEKDKEIAALKERVETAEAEKQAKQEELDSITESLEKLGNDKTTLEQQLSNAQQAIKTRVGNKQELEAKVAQLQTQIKENDEAQQQKLDSLTDAKASVELAAQQAKKAYEQQIATLSQQVQAGTSQVQTLQQQIQQQSEALEREQSTHKTTLQETQSKLDEATQALVLAQESGGQRTAALQKEVDKLAGAKDELVKKNELAAQHESDKISRLESEKTQALAELTASKDIEIAALTKRAETAEAEKQAKQKELDTIQVSLDDLDKEKSTLAQQLSKAQQSIEKEGGDKTKLAEEIARLKQQMKTNDEAQQQKLDSLTDAKASVELAAQQAKKAYEQQIATLRQEVETGTSQVQTLQQQIQQQSSDLKQEQASHQAALTDIQGKLDKATQALVLAQESGGQRTAALQKQVDKLAGEKDVLVANNQLAQQQALEKIKELELEKGKALVDLAASKDQEITALTKRAEAAEADQQAKREKLEKIQASLDTLDKEKATLTEQLSKAQQAIQKGGGDKDALKAEVALLTQQLEAAKRAELQAQKAAKAAKEALNKANKEHQDALKAEKAARKSLTQIDVTPKKMPAQKPVEVQTPATNKISDNVSIVSGDQILRDFRELRRMQRDVVVGSQTIADAPKGNEAFHKYASQHGAAIGNGLDPEISELMGAIEREKYQEIHRKYPHSDIEWKGGNQASISRDGIEICKLSNKPVAVSDPAIYKLGGTTIANYRNLDLPVQAKGGPMHMSLAVKDLQGKNISDKDAVYLTAHYDKEGKLVEMTMPIPVYFTVTDKDSPVCIKRKGKIYTLPVNRGKYEEMIRAIEVNKGIEIGVGKSTKTQDSIILGSKTGNKVKSLVPPQVVNKLKPHTAKNGVHSVVSKKVKGTRSNSI